MLAFINKACFNVFMKLIKKIKNFFQRQLDRIPTRLPNGATEFETWSKSLIDTYGFPDNDSVRFMLAAMIMHTGQTAAYVPRRFFALSGLAAASKEVAHACMVVLKDRQQAKAQAEESPASSLSLVQPTAAPVIPQVAPNVGKS